MRCRKHVRCKESFSGSRRPNPLERMMGVAKHGVTVTAILDHIRSLEGYVERSGARLVRTTLPERVQGRACCGLITLRTGLEPEQELLALVHELVHWLAHRHARPGLCCTVFEYEAEAVEAVVMTRLGMPRPGLDVTDFDGPTDGLLSASFTRVTGRAVVFVVRSAWRPSGLLQSRKPPSTSRQRPVKKSFSNMNSTAWAISSGCPRRFNGTGAVILSNISGRIEERISVCVKPGAIDPTRMP